MAEVAKGLNAQLGGFVGMLAVVTGLMLALGDGFIAGGGIIALAGALLWRLESPRRGAAGSFLLRFVLFPLLVFFGLMFIVG